MKKTRLISEVFYILKYKVQLLDGLPRWLSGKESTYQCRRHGFDPWSGKIPGEENGNPLQYSCLEYSMVGRVWQATYSPWSGEESDMS